MPINYALMRDIASSAVLCIYTSADAEWTHSTSRRFHSLDVLHCDFLSCKTAMKFSWYLFKNYQTCIN
jgi:hypothetical protein